MSVTTGFVACPSCCNFDPCDPTASTVFYATFTGDMAAVGSVELTWDGTAWSSEIIDSGLEGCTNPRIRVYLTKTSSDCEFYLQVVFYDPIEDGGDMGGSIEGAALADPEGLDFELYFSGLAVTPPADVDSCNTIYEATQITVTR